MKLTWWIAALAGLALAAVIWPSSAGAEDYAKTLRNMRQVHRDKSPEQHMAQYRRDVKASMSKPINHMGTKPGKRELKTPQNRGKKCGSIYSVR